MVTVTSAVPVRVSSAARIVASPLTRACTRPMESTVATCSLPDTQTNSVHSTGFPLLSCASAVRRRVSPTSISTVAGETATWTTSLRTETPALSVAPPATAVIVAVPSPTARASPEAVIDATEGSVLAQLTVAPVITLPF